MNDETLRPAAAEGRIVIDGGDVVWRRFGDGAGTPLLVVHGGPGAPSDYLETLSELSDERPVYFWDQLGCGRSDRPSGAHLWQRERFVEEMARVRQALGLNSAHMLGHSWGVMLILDYLKAHGQAGVQSLVLAGPVISGARHADDLRKAVDALPSEHRAAIAEAERTEAYDTPGYLAATGMFNARYLARATTPETAALLERTFAGLGQECYVAMNGPSEFSFTGSLRSYESEAELKRLGMPVLFLGGEFDTCSPETASHYAKVTPNARAIAIPGSGHLTTIDAPTATNRAVRSFLRMSETAGA